MRPDEQLLEEAFALTYVSQGGVRWADVWEMDRRDAEWYLERLRHQKEAETEAYRKAGKP